VMRELHVGLTERLAAYHHKLVPVMAKNDVRGGSRTLRNDYFRCDPVLRQNPRLVADVDALLLLDVDAHTPFAQILNNKRERNLPVIGLIHDIFPLNRELEFPDSSRRAFRAYLQWTLHVSDLLVVYSQHVKNQLQNLGWKLPKQIEVIPLGSSFNANPPEKSNGECISLIYVSSLRAYKGHKLLLEAFDLLLEDGYDVNLTFIGGDDGTDVSKDVRYHPRFGGRLRWLEGVSDLEMRTAARYCSLGVIPSEDEGFGLFLEEGLSHGLKMVVREIPVFKERLQTNVFTFSSSAIDLQKAIIEAHKTPWQSPDKKIRSMREFVDDWFDLLIEFVPAFDRL
jgi:glycosyltransferase involved in cell wall biosynthesis